MFNVSSALVKKKVCWHQESFPNIESIKHPHAHRENEIVFFWKRFAFKIQPGGNYRGGDGSKGAWGAKSWVKAYCREYVYIWKICSRWVVALEPVGNMDFA